MLISIEEAIARIKDGKMVILVDDENRENEGDLVIAAQHVTPELINFMAKYARGLICAPIDAERARKLALPPMAPENTALHGTRFTVSVDARHGITTGISAQDRARTVQVLVDDGSTPDDLARPGHVFPLIAQEGGVLKRAGHTEAAVDLARLAGLKPAAVICEVMNEDGTMARLPLISRSPASPISSPTASGTRTWYSGWRQRSFRPVTEISRSSAIPAQSRMKSTWPSSREMSPARRTCSCACTPSASPGMSSDHTAATAGTSFTTRWR